MPLERLPLHPTARVVPQARTEPLRTPLAPLTQDDAQRVRLVLLRGAEGSVPASEYELATFGALERAGLWNPAIVGPGFWDMTHEARWLWVEKWVEVAVEVLGLDDLSLCPVIGNRPTRLQSLAPCLGSKPRHPLFYPSKEQTFDQEKGRIMQPQAQVGGSRPIDIPLIKIQQTLEQVMAEVNAVPKPKKAGPKVYQGEFLSDREEEAEKDREEADDLDPEKDASADDDFKDYPDDEAQGSGDGDAFASETDEDFSDRPVGEHSRQRPAGEEAPKPKTKGRGRR